MVKRARTWYSFPMNATALFLGLVFSVCGLAYFIYGKKQANWIAMASGAGLCLFPYFISNLWLMAAFGIALLAVPFIFRDY